MTFFFSPNHGYVVAELDDRKKFDDFKEKFEKDFDSSPEMVFQVFNWDPGKMPLPWKSDLALHVKGASNTELAEFTDRVLSLESKYNCSIYRNY